MSDLPAAKGRIRLFVMSVGYSVRQPNRMGAKTVSATTIKKAGHRSSDNRPRGSLRDVRIPGATAQPSSDVVLLQYDQHLRQFRKRTSDKIEPRSHAREQWEQWVMHGRPLPRDPDQPPSSQQEQNAGGPERPALRVPEALDTQACTVRETLQAPAGEADPV